MLIVDPGKNACMVRCKPWMIRPGGAGGGPPPVDYEAEVEALLSGTTGWAIDPSDAATLFTDTAGTVPVSSSGVDTVARINSKFGTTGYNWVNATAASEALWNGTYNTHDGVDDWFDAGAADTFSINAPGVTLTWRGELSSLVGPSYLYGTGRGTFGQMFMPMVNADGSVSFHCRRLLADTITTITSATGLITVGVPFTLQFIADYAGTGDLSAILDGTEIASGTMLGTPANSENTSPTRSRIGRIPTNTTTTMYAGNAGRIVYARSVLDATDLASCRGWVEEVAI